MNYATVVKNLFIAEGFIVSELEVRSENDIYLKVSGDSYLKFSQYLGVLSLSNKIFMSSYSSKDNITDFEAYLQFEKVDFSNLLKEPSDEVNLFYIYKYNSDRADQYITSTLNEYFRKDFDICHLFSGYDIREESYAFLVDNKATKRKDLPLAIIQNLLDIRYGLSESNLVEISDLDKTEVTSIREHKSSSEIQSILVWLSHSKISKYINIEQIYNNKIEYSLPIDFDYDNEVQDILSKYHCVLKKNLDYRKFGRR